MITSQLIKETSIYGFGDFLFRALAFFVFPIYTHIFTLEEFGVMNLVVTIASLIGIFLNMGINNAIHRFYWSPEINENTRPALVTTGFFILCLWSLFITGLALFGFSIFQKQLHAQFQITWFILLLSLIANIPNQIIQYCMDILRLHFSPWKFTLISGGKNILGIIIGLCLIIYLKLGLNGYFLGNLLGLLVIVPVSLFYIKKDLCLCFKKDLAKQIIHFGYPFIFAGLAYWIFGSVDRWMLGGIADTSQVGLYSVAFKFASIIIFANMAFGQAWTPIAMKIYSEKSNYQNTFARVLTVWFFILLLGGAAICYFSREILTILTPPAYWPAVNTLNFLAMGTVIFGTTQVTVLGISLAKKTQILSFIAWFTALVNLICNFILIPRFGSVGAAIATLVSYCVLTGFYLFWSQRLNPIPIEHFKLISIIILVLCTIAISQLLNKFSLSIELFVTKVCIIVFYIIIGHFLRIINWQELKSALKGKTT